MFDIISQVARIDHELGLKKNKEKISLPRPGPYGLFLVFTPSKIKIATFQ